MNGEFFLGVLIFGCWFWVLDMDVRYVHSKMSELISSSNKDN